MESWCCYSLHCSLESLLSTCLVLENGNHTQENYIINYDSIMNNFGGCIPNLAFPAASSVFASDFRYLVRIWSAAKQIGTKTILNQSYAKIFIYLTVKVKKREMRLFNKPAYVYTFTSIYANVRFETAHWKFASAPQTPPSARLLWACGSHENSSHESIFNLYTMLPSSDQIICWREISRCLLEKMTSFCLVSRDSQFGKQLKKCFITFKLQYCKIQHHGPDMSDWYCIGHLLDYNW